MSLDGTSTTGNLAFIVSGLQLVALKWLLGYIGKGAKTQHELLEAIVEQCLTHHLFRILVKALHIKKSAKVVVTPIGIRQPIPLKGMFGLKKQQTGGKFFLLTTLKKERKSVANHSNSTHIERLVSIVGRETEGDIPSTIFILHQSRMSAHKQFIQLAHCGNLANFSETVALVTHGKAFPVTKHTEIVEMSSIKHDGETVVLFISDKGIVVVVGLIGVDFNVAHDFVSLTVCQGKTKIGNLKIKTERLAATRSERTTNSLVGEIILAERPTFRGVSGFFDAHLAITPTEVKSDGLLILSDHIDKIVWLCAEVDSTDRFYKFVTITKHIDK